MFSVLLLFIFVREVDYFFTIGSDAKIGKLSTHEWLHSAAIIPSSL